MTCMHACCKHYRRGVFVSTPKNLDERKSLFHVLVVCLDIILLSKTPGENISRKSLQ